MIECKKCKTQCSDTSKFCTICGEVLSFSGDVNAFEAARGYYPNRMYNRNYEVDYPKKRRTSLIKVFYGLLLFFVLIPLIFPSNTFRGYGSFGYGLRQQITSFANLADANMSTGLLLLIYSFVILLITAVIFSAAFSIVTIIFLGRSNSKRMPINEKLLKIFTSLVFYGFTFVFLVTIPYLTFSFICAYLLSFLSLLISYKQSFANDLLLRNGNEDNNSKSTKIFVYSILLACCFSPVYYSSTYDYRISYNFFDFIKGLFGQWIHDVAGFLRVISVILIIIAFLLFCFSVVRYLFISNKMKLYFVDLIALSLSIVFLILVGAFIRVESLRSEQPLKLTSNYYIFLSLAIAALVIPLIQKAVDIKKAKKSLVNEQP